MCWELESRWFAVKGGHSDRRFSAIKPLGIAHGTGTLKRLVSYEFRRGCGASVDRHLVSRYFEELANNPVPRGGKIDKD